MTFFLIFSKAIRDIGNIIIVSTTLYKPTIFHSTNYLISITLATNIISNTHPSRLAAKTWRRHECKQLHCEGEAAQGGGSEAKTGGDSTASGSSTCHGTAGDWPS